METTWFCLLVWMLATYVVLGGCDLGVGIVHLLVARNDAERSQVIRTIRPVWKPNEVWLVAAGGTLFLAFPTAFAASFSGFYLALMIVLWLLVFRGLGIELRYQMPDQMWTQAWDVVLSIASLLLALCLGAALGNVVRGVPLNAEGVFFEPLWTNFRVDEPTGILDWYTVLVGITAVVALSHHGALWLSSYTDGEVEQRAKRLAARLLIPLLVLLVVLDFASFAVRSDFDDHLLARPWGAVFPILAVAGLIGAAAFRRRNKSRHAFVASCASLYGMVATAAIGVYPYILPGRDPAFGLTASDAAAPSGGLIVALYWWIPGMLMVCACFAFVYSRMPTKFPIEADSQRPEP